MSPCVVSGASGQLSLNASGFHSPKTDKSNNDGNHSRMVYNALCGGVFFCRYKQRAAAWVSLGTVLRASKQCCGEKSQPVDTGTHLAF